MCNTHHVISVVSPQFRNRFFILIALIALRMWVFHLLSFLLLISYWFLNKVFELVEVYSLISHISNFLAIPASSVSASPSLPSPLPRRTYPQASLSLPQPSSVNNTLSSSLFLFSHSASLLFTRALIPLLLYSSSFFSTFPALPRHFHRVYVNMHIVLCSQMHCR